MKTRNRTEFRDYVKPTGQTWLQRNVTPSGLAFVVAIIGLVGLLMWCITEAYERSLIQ